MGDSDRRWVDAMPAAYEEHLVGAVFRPFAVDLAARVATYGPRRVLELAAGTGVLTEELRRVLPDAGVVATDLNEAMVDLGRSHVPDADWRQADALALPFAGPEFDVVVCQFGVMFFPDKAQAYAEARRVLTPGGRLIVSAWDVLPTHDFQAAVVAALERVFPGDPPRFIASVPHGYADSGVITADLVAAGFDGVDVETAVLQGTADSAESIAVGFCTGTPLRAELEARGDLAELTARVAHEVEQRLGKGPVTGRMSAHVATGRVIAGRSRA